MSLLLLLRESTYAPGASVAKFTGAKDVSVRLRSLSGAWEVCGSDHARGIIPENVELRADQWGSSRATFDLRRNAKEFWPDIAAFTPVEIEIGGARVWSGRITETPVRDSTDSVISIQCEGWQAHLDDDLYEKIYVHTNLTEWKDARSALGATLTVLTAAPQVQVGDGVLSLVWPASTATNGSAAAMLDLGPNSTAARVVIDWSLTAGAATRSLSFGYGSSPDANAATLNTISSSTSAGSGTYSYTLPTAGRFIFLVHKASAHTPSADEVAKFTSIQVFASTAYESASTSILKADVLVKDALSRATSQLSADRTQIAAGTFNIPEFAPSEPRTPRAVWEAADAFEDRYKKISVDKVPVYKAKPTYPEVEVGAWSGMEFEDSSSNSADDVYSRVMMTGDQPTGMPLRVTRSQSDLTGAASTTIGAAFTNPGFETNTTGWTASFSTITRDTATYDGGVASGRWDSTGASDAFSFGFLSTTPTGTFTAGVTYSVTIRVNPSLTSYYSSGYVVSLGVIGSDSNTTTIPKAAGWQTVQVSWTPQTTVSSGVSLFFAVSLDFDPMFMWIDSVSLSYSEATAVESQGFQRTKQLSTSFMLTDAAAKQIADKWLLSHKTTPFKGKAKITGNDAIRDITSGRPVAPEQMLLRTGELIRFSDRIDPDTGAQGRDGKIVEASYKVDDNSVELTIDSSRAGFEALLNRLGVVLGQMR